MHPKTRLASPSSRPPRSIVGQAAVLKVGFRPVAATGMTLMGARSLLLTQVSVGGSYFGDIFIGLLVFGPGIGLAFVTATVAALAGAAEHESGLASGLSNTALQVGVAIASTVAVSGSEDYLAAHEGANPLVVLTDGFQSAFLAVVVLAGIGMALALLLLGRPRKAPHKRLEPVPATAPRSEERGTLVVQGDRRQPRRLGRGAHTRLRRDRWPTGPPIQWLEPLLLVTRGRRSATALVTGQEITVDGGLA